MTTYPHRGNNEGINFMDFGNWEKTLYAIHFLAIS